MVIDHVRSTLAAYKAPRRVRFVTSIGRSPSGKVDYGRHRAETAAWAGVALA
jgi:acyl-CoA synthetase (AMP-forming)/AMP-acid ligase II